MKNILEFLEQTKTRFPNHTAVDDGMFRFTWEELLNASMKIGSQLSRRISPGKPVVILAEKSALTLAAMFGIVYAGCFYIVIDPDVPPARIRRIFQTLAPSLVIVNRQSRQIFLETGYETDTFLLHDALAEAADLQILADIRSLSRDSDLLYGIFTSGSSGTPKCITVTHRAAIDFIGHFTKLFGFTPDDRIGSQAPFDFDISVKDIYTCMATGAALILIPKKLFSTPPLLLDYICVKKITVLIWAVSALCMISALKGLQYKVPHDVKKIMFSGEIMPPKQLRLWQTALPGAEFVNLYGPAEITCNCTYYPVRELFSDNETLPIGKPLPGRVVFLLDHDGKEITEPDITGEICVAGESLSEGYYHNPDETKKHFLSVPCPGGCHAKFYRTGDMGYYDTDKTLYFSGRRDFQIKHMGHRIELEEIEHAVRLVSGVEQCCCLMDKTHHKLTAFYLGYCRPDQIRETLIRTLPVYMIPHKIIQTTYMPLNKNGKTDREYFQRQLTGETI